MIRSPFFLPFFLLSSSVFSLAAAYIAQYGFDLKPCILCLYQRLPYAGVIVLSLLSVFLVKHYKIVTAIYILSVIFLLIGAGIAFYHVGVEHKWFAGPDVCAGQGGETPKTLEEMRAQLIGTKAVRCDQPQFIFLTLSMAGWNMLWALFLAATTIGIVYKGRKNGR